MNENMKKKMYIEPKMEVSMMENEALMRPASPGVEDGYDPGAPKRVVTPTNPVAPADTVQVF